MGMTSGHLDNGKLFAKSVGNSREKPAGEEKQVIKICKASPYKPFHGVILNAKKMVSVRFMFSF